MKIIHIIFIVLFPLAIMADDFVMNNVAGGCGTAYYYQGVLEPNQHTCGSGYFLPANYDEGCVACSSGATCSGGTYAFSEMSARGIKYNTPLVGNISRGCNNKLVASGTLVAVYDRNTYTCTPGYYVPANHDGCMICPSDSYCPGGTYTFNETVTQGITACASGLFAPAGMWESAQCGRILHIGDEVVYLRASKKTSPALHVDVDNDGIADFFGNATTADVVMHAGSIHKLKLQVGDTVYSIYDDTVSVE